LQKVNSGDCCQALLATPQSPASRSDLDINQLGHAHAECKSNPAKSKTALAFQLEEGREKLTTLVWRISQEICLKFWQRATTQLSITIDGFSHWENKTKFYNSQQVVH